MRSGASTKKRKRPQSALRKKKRGSVNALAKGRSAVITPAASQPSPVLWVARMERTRTPWVISRGAWMALTSGVGRVAISPIGEEAPIPRLLLLIPSVVNHPRRIKARSHLHRPSHLQQIPDMRLPRDIRPPTIHRSGLAQTRTSVPPLRFTVVHLAVTPSRPSCPAPGPLRPTPCLTLVPGHTARDLALRLRSLVLFLLRTGPGPGPVRHRPCPLPTPPALVPHRLSRAHRPRIMGSLASRMAMPSRAPHTSVEARLSLDWSSRRRCCLHLMGSAALRISLSRTLSLTP